MHKCAKAILWMAAIAGLVFVIGTRISCNCYPCQCYGWTSENVSWTGTSPGSLITNCGSTVNISSIDSGTNVKIINFAPCGNCPSTFSWTVTKAGSTEGPWSGNTLPVIFTPVSAGHFDVAENITCGSMNCAPCHTEIDIGTVQYACTGWSQATVTWLHASQQQQWTQDSLNTIATISTADPCTPITVSATNNCSTGCTLSENWTVMTPSGTIISGDGSTASFIPPSTGGYTVTFNAFCGDIPCPPKIIQIKIEGAECPCTCPGWGDNITASWEAYSAQETMSGHCGENFTISSITSGTSVTVHENANCNPGCPLSENWTVTNLSGTYQDSGQGPTALFTPAGADNFTVTFYASCDNSSISTACPPCSSTIQIGDISPDPCTDPQNIVQQLIINTGYNPSTGLAYPLWQPDAYWEVVGSPGSLPIPCPAWTVKKRDVWITPSSQGNWIAPFPSIYEGEHSQDNPPAYRLQRVFCTSNTTQNITIDLNLWVDNVAEVYFDGNPVAIGAETDGHAFDNTFGKSIIYSAIVGPGQHFLWVDIHNYGESMGLYIEGTVKSLDTHGLLSDNCCSTSARIVGNKLDDCGDRGLPGWTIQLKDVYGNPVAETITGYNGFYCFNDLPAPNTYIVSEQMQPDWQQTTPGGTGTYTVQLAAGQVAFLNFHNCLNQVSCATWWGFSADWLGHSYFVNCGDNMTIASIPPNMPITIRAYQYCLPITCPATENWTITNTSGTFMKDGLGAVIDHFVPPAPDDYLVTFNSSCGCSRCPPCTCKMTVADIDPCFCAGWLPAAVCWNGPNGPETAPLQYNGQVVIPEASSADNITVTAGIQCSLTCPDCQPSYHWAITSSSGATVASGSGSTASFKPEVPGPPYYNITFEAKCGTKDCHEYWAAIKINDITLKPVGPCQSWNQATVTWSGSSPGTWTGPCGGGAAPAKIESVNAGTAVQISSGVTCSSADLQPAYTWAITSSSRATVASGSGSTASFIPESPGSYSAVFNASCGGTACQSTCSIPIQINHITSRPAGGISGIPFTCSCGAWGPATVTWPGGSQNVSCTPAAQAPVVSIPSLTSGSAVQINSSVACGPGIFNIFTHEACQANENWTVTSVFSGQGPWTGSGSTASFVPTKEGSFTVVFKASCGSAVCSTCEIHIVVKNMETGGLQPSAPVIISFTAIPAQVSPQESVTLNWTITGDGEATLECAGEKHSVPFTGSMAITPAQSGCCILTASNEAGSDQKTACITVLSPKAAPPHINFFSASSTQIYAGNPVMLSWQISGTGNAYLNCGGEQRQVPFSGSATIVPPQSGCCTLSVSNSSGSDQKSACITVIQRPPVTPPVIPPQPPETPPRR